MSSTRQILSLLAFSALTFATPRFTPTRTISKRQDAALPENPFTCLNSNRLAGACCITNENPDYTNFYCAAANGTAVEGVGAFTCPTKANDRAVSSWCCSVVDHGGEDDGYTLWCEDGVAGQLVDSTSLSLSGVESAVAVPSLAAVESQVASLTSSTGTEAVESTVSSVETKVSGVADTSALDKTVSSVEAQTSGIADASSVEKTVSGVADTSSVEKTVSSVTDTSALKSTVSDVTSKVDTSAVSKEASSVESSVKSETSSVGTAAVEGEVATVENTAKSAAGSS